VKIFVWVFVDKLTDNWHSGGGLVVVAEDEAAARASLLVDNAVDLSADKAPDHVYELAGVAEPKFFIFPDAGCC
jgi:hypothetical protein